MSRTVWTQEMDFSLKRMSFRGKFDAQITDTFNAAWKTELTSNALKVRLQRITGKRKAR